MAGIRIDYNNDSDKYLESPVSPGVPARALITFPVDAPRGAVGSIETLEYRDAPFKATVSFSKNLLGDPHAVPSSIERSFHFQIAGGANPRSDCVQVEPGSTWIVYVTVGHEGGVGKKSHNMAFYYRKPQ